MCGWAEKERKEKEERRRKKREGRWGLEIGAVV
jgi:hypothetical protein